jgi:superfamily II helicase
MQITINISDKQIKSAISELLDNEIFQQYDAAIIKRAQFKKSVTAKDLFECAQFQASLSKALTQVAEGAVEDNLFETVCYDIQVPQVEAIIKLMDKANEELQESRLQAEEKAEVERMVKTLERAGFKIVKA